MFLIMTSRAPVCALNSAHPGLLDRSNKGVKFTHPWNSAGYNCRNKLLFCANVLSITSIRALQVCAWNVALPGLSHRTVFFNSGSAKHVSALVFRKTCGGVPWVSRVPWGFLVLFRGNDFLLQYVDASLWNFSGHRAAFRLQVAS